jgi:hypothetical protein
VEWRQALALGLITPEGRITRRGLEFAAAPQPSLDPDPRWAARRAAQHLPGTRWGQPRNHLPRRAGLGAGLGAGLTARLRRICRLAWLSLRAMTSASGPSLI